jgi:hypothetical protein
VCVAHEGGCVKFEVQSGKLRWSASAPSSPLSTSVRQPADTQPLYLRSSSRRTPARALVSSRAARITPETATTPSPGPCSGQSLSRRACAPRLTAARRTLEHAPASTRSLEDSKLPLGRAQRPANGPSQASAHPARTTAPLAHACRVLRSPRTLPSVYSVRAASSPSSEDKEDEVRGFMFANTPLAIPVPRARSACRRPTRLVCPASPSTCPQCS